MAKWLFGWILCFFTTLAAGQNMLANTGFEERNTCSEYQVRCAPEAWFFLPRYARMSPVERDSNHYEIITMGLPREPHSAGNFIYTKMLCKLQPGVRYRLTLRIYVPTFDFDFLDFWVSAGEPGSKNHSLFGKKDYHSIPPDSIYGKGKRWRAAAFTFTAKGNEQFFTIGNFQQKALVKAKRSSGKKRPVEYWIDDLSLMPVDAVTFPCNEYEAIKDQVYRNNARHPGRFIESIPLDSTMLADAPAPQPIPKTDTVVLKPQPVISKPDTLVIPDVLFEFNSSRLNQQFIPALDSLVKKISDIRFSRMLIAGHTDDIGSDEYNLKLSADRAVTIRNYLAERLQLPGERIETIGHGESMPRATNSTAAGRQQNRRVEIILFYQ